jgi:hypothetical protein
VGRVSWPRNSHILRAERASPLEGSSAVLVIGKKVVQGAGLGIAARVQEDGPETWEASYLHLENRCDGGPVITLRLNAGVGAPAMGRRRSVHQVVGRWRGTTEAAADGEEESEDRIVAMRTGNRKAPGPGGAKAVRVDVSFWRGT